MWRTEAPCQACLLDKELQKEVKGPCIHFLNRKPPVCFVSLRILKLEWCRFGSIITKNRFVSVPTGTGSFRLARGTGSVRFGSDLFFLCVQNLFDFSRVAFIAACGNADACGWSRFCFLVGWCNEPPEVLLDLSDRTRLFPKGFSVSQFVLSRS